MKNFATAVVLLMAGECAVVSILYGFNGNTKLALYWLGITIVNAVASTF
jgi:hypothetical protein